MKNSSFLEKELQLRKLFIKLVKKKADKQDIFYPEISWFLDGCPKVGLNEIKGFWEKHIDKVKYMDNWMSLILSIPF